MKNFMTIMFTMLTLVMMAFSITGCEGDKDENKAPVEEVKCDPACTENQECELVEEKATCVEKAAEEVKCDPVCDADKQECKLVEDKPVCVDKTPVVEESECSEAKPCTDDKVCKEGKCEAKSEAKCDPVCGGDEICSCTGSDPVECVCSKKEAEQEAEAKCDPDCAENQECKCESGKCKCIDKTPAEESNPEAVECGDGKPECAEGKECKEGKCEDKVAAGEESKPEGECDGKSAGDECAEGKICQDDNGALACKDKPAEQEPAK